MNALKLARRLATARAPSVADLFTDDDLEQHGYVRMATDVLQLLAAERRLCGVLARGDRRVPLHHGPVIERDWEAGYLAGRGDAAHAVLARDLAEDIVATSCAMMRVPA